MTVRQANNEERDPLGNILDVIAQDVDWRPRAFTALNENLTLRLDTLAGITAFEADKPIIGGVAL